MIDLIAQEIQEYAEAHTSAEPDYLRELREYTQKEVPGAQMLSGHLQGQLLRLLSKMLQPGQIVEVGTYTGYSAICLAGGLRPGGKLHTIDRSQEMHALANKYFEKAGLEAQIETHTGDAGEILPRLKGPFDLAFIDADKKHYSTYYETILNKMSHGGVILIDNTLWSGKVLEAERDETTEAIHRLNEQLSSDTRVDHVLLPLRDGMTIVRKKAD